MKNVQRKTEPFVPGRIPDVKELIKALPDMIRICPQHGDEKTEGCCDAAIEGVTELLQLIDRAKKRYKEELAPLLEPHHTGEIVGIELETGDYFVGKDEVAAADKAREAGNEGVLFFLRIGFPHRFIRLTSNADSWLGQMLRVPIIVSSKINEAILGNQMLENCRLTIDYGHRTVTIIESPV